jgi:hypothetical protein
MVPKHRLGRSLVITSMVGLHVTQGGCQGEAGQLGEIVPPTVADSGPQIDADHNPRDGVSEPLGDASEVLQDAGQGSDELTEDTLGDETAASDVAGAGDSSIDAEVSVLPECGSCDALAVCREGTCQIDPVLFVVVMPF